MSHMLICLLALRSVLQLKEVPPRPPEFDGKLCLGNLCRGVGEGAIRAALKTFDSTELYYTISGDGPIDFILCDGIGCDGFIWRYLVDELRSRGRVIHLHMRGHGKSASPTELDHLHIHHLADDWSVLLAAERKNQTVVLGHSMGVQVALELWNRHPHHVGAMVLMCGSYGHPVSTFHDDATLEKILPLIKQAAHLGGDRLHRIWRRLIKLRDCV